MLHPALLRHKYLIRSDPNFTRLAAAGPPLHLTVAHTNGMQFADTLQVFPANGTEPIWSWLDTEVLVTLFDHIALTYGREHVLELVLAMRRYDSWQRLIPAVFGIPVQEFEVGWLAYATQS